MSLDKCPFCGKTFKRLKSHLPHCKMAPESKTSMVSTKPKKILAVTLKHTGNKDKTNKVNTKNTDSGSKVKSNVKSKKTEKAKVDKNKKLLQNASFTPRSTASEVLSTEEMSTDNLKPKTKWLAKREREIFKLQATIKFTSVSLEKMNSSKAFTNPVKDTHVLEKEIDSERKLLRSTYLASQLSTNRNNFSAADPIQIASLSTNRQEKHFIPVCKENVSSQVQNPQALTKDDTSGSSYQEPGMPVFQHKTCLWDHIQYGLHKRRHASVPVLFPIASGQNVSFTKLVNKPHTENDQDATVKVFSELCTTLQSSTQSPIKDTISLQFHDMSVLPYFPDMATGYGKTCFISSHSESSNKNALQKSPTSHPLPKSQGLMTELKLGDVKLNELAPWLGAQTPKSPKAAAAMFHKGWQWYYRKYIDVQKGGIGGIAMLIGGYCVLSYIWSYPHIKKDCWRKYH